MTHLIRSARCGAACTLPFVGLLLGSSCIAPTTPPSTGSTAATTSATAHTGTSGASDDTGQGSAVGWPEQCEVAVTPAWDCGVIVGCWRSPGLRNGDVPYYYYDYAGFFSNGAYIEFEFDSWYLGCFDCTGDLLTDLGPQQAGPGGTYDSTTDTIAWRDRTWERYGDEAACAYLWDYAY